MRSSLAALYWPHSLWQAIDNPAKNRRSVHGGPIDKFSKVQQVLGITIKDPALLREALSHRSCGKGNYERLEFLGDAVLNLVIAEALYKRYEKLDEGTLSRMRASLVRGQTLADIARHYSLGDYILLGEGELKSGVFRRDSILADIVESIIGAVFSEQGFDGARQFILKLFDTRLDNVSTDLENLKDPKSRLQELLLSYGLPIPDYVLLETSGKPHEQQFTIECRVECMELTENAVASSRRKAEQAAAASLLDNPAMNQADLKKAAANQR